MIPNILPPSKLGIRAAGNPGTCHSRDDPKASRYGNYGHVPNPMDRRHRYSRIVRSDGGAPTAGAVGTSLRPVQSALALRPRDQIRVKAFAVLVVEEVGEDWSVEARIVQLDREIVAALVGALRPGGPDLGLMRSSA